MKRVLVTGANSLLASSLVPRLLERGYAVRGLVRRRESYSGEPHPRLEITEGDFTCVDTLYRVLPDCELVVHCAALTDQGARWSEYLRVNVTATRTLMEVAASFRVERFVYVSSANAFAFGSEDAPGDETKPLRPPFSDSFYASSKAAAQALAADFRGVMDVVTVNPTFMIGRCRAGSGSARIIGMGIDRRVVFYPPGGKNFVHVDDVARGIVLALERATDGEAYLLAGENLSYGAFFRMLSDVCGQKPVFVRIPAFLLLAVGAAGSLFGFLGLRSEVNFTNMRILCTCNYYTAVKSSLYLGMSYRPIREAIKEAVRSLEPDTL